MTLCGDALFYLGAIDSKYIDAMWERELILSSYIGEGVAIPHGTDDSRKYVNFDQLVFFRFDQPIDWEGEKVLITLGIASKSNDHVEILARLAEILLDDDLKKVLLESNSKIEILETLTKGLANESRNV